MTHTTISGDFEERFAPLVKRLDEQLASTPYGGAALVVYQDGAPVVDVWGGYADITTGRPWVRDTPVLMYSSSKSIAAIVTLRLAEQGVIDLDAPVATYWPEFGRHGKERVTVREVMAHRAGLPYIDADLSREEVLAVGPLVEALADQRPAWEPGTAHAYHALTVGAILGEIVRRATDKTLGTVLREDLTLPLDLDLWIGLPEDIQGRAAMILPAEPAGASSDLLDAVRAVLAEDDRVWRTLSLNDALPLPATGVTMKNAYNDPAVRAAELPAGNAVGTARSLAALHAGLIGAVPGHGLDTPLLTELTIADATRPLSWGAPVFGAFGEPYPVWGSGFLVPSEVRPMLGPSSFGHDGAAGALCFADPEHRIGFAYLPSVMGSMPDLRSNVLVDELRSCLS
ncbi:serine hydrolase domain-containing protein [Nocardioides sp. NPDC051685]|uniref:serine hydrolase domain-containing protein n=1 Tax=Nocardioides sp. NPDC051685 TaxID=3364334 RepID=UPI00378BB65D